MIPESEIRELIDRVCMEEATAEEVRALDRLIQDDAEIRATYLKSAELHNGLRDFSETKSLVSAVKNLSMAGHGPEVGQDPEVSQDSLVDTAKLVDAGPTWNHRSFAIIATIAGCIGLMFWVSARYEPSVISSPLAEHSSSQSPSTDLFAEKPSGNRSKLIRSTGSVKHPGLADTVSTVRRDRPIKFNRDIRPILSETCFHCHGPDEHGRRADLRLDTIEGATADLGGHHAIVPGKLDDSEAWQRILSDDPDLRMPPPESHMVLTPSQKEAMRRWIEEGAVYEGHWAFEAPVRHLPPETEHRSGKNEIDAFVLSQLEQEGLKPSVEADPRTLIRRLTFDLTGLPPTVDQIRQFLDDYQSRGEEAWQDAITRLIDSPHFGERMAVPWMDQSRYADSNGYSIDGGRQMWLWRDWVIQAYNDNMPFDQFVVDQLAGDLLPNATKAQRIATGFNRNHMVTHEGGTIPEENLTNYAADRVKTTSEVFLGLTMGCAQCHDHKYDPISQQEYYEFFAFFNELSDRGLDGNAGNNPAPKIMARSVIETDELDDLRVELKQLEEQWANSMQGYDSWLATAREDVSAMGDGFQSHPLKTLDALSPNPPGLYKVLPDGSVFLKYPSAGLNAFSHVLELPAGDPIEGIRVHFLPYAKTLAKKPEKESGDKSEADKPAAEAEQPVAMLTPHTDGVPKVTTVLVSAGDLPTKQVDFYRQLTLARATASSSVQGRDPVSVLDERNVDWWQPVDGEKQQHLTITFAEPVDPSETRFLSVMIFFGVSNSLPFHWRIDGFSGRDTDSLYPPPVTAALRRAKADWTPEEANLVGQEFRNRDAGLAILRTRIENTRERIDVLTKHYPTMVMDTAKNPRQTFVLARGQYDAPLEKVFSNTLRVLPPLSVDTESTEEVGTEEAGTGEPIRGTRLDLARWLVRSDHPLTARVAVNRIWSLFFGIGFVATSADFGSQGEWPSHPELLDWLATEFISSDWNQKDLIRKIVSSATYRQDSSATAEQIALDPQNRLLGRGSRFRLPAEFIRDQALSVSGLLVPRIGGPSVHPYQPPGLWKEVSHFGSTPATKQVFVQDKGEKLYRRSLYTFVKRTSPHPSMAAFDAPNREMCIMQRGVTNTPMQALVTLNDPQFSEAARVFAQRLLIEMPDAGTDARLREAFERITSRQPVDRELDTLRSFLTGEKERYRNDVDAAKRLIGTGESPIDQTLDPADFAAWTSAASLLMNLSEALTRS